MTGSAEGEQSGERLGHLETSGLSPKMAPAQVCVRVRRRLGDGESEALKDSRRLYWAENPLGGSGSWQGPEGRANSLSKWNVV